MGSGKSLESEQHDQSPPKKVPANDSYESLGGPNTILIDKIDKDELALKKQEENFESYHTNKPKESPTSEPKKSSTAAPYDPNKYFPEEKKVWRQKFMEEFQKFLENPDDETILEAFNSHQSIKDASGNAVVFENKNKLYEALNDIRDGQYSQYSIHQEGRFGSELALALGINTSHDSPEKNETELEKIFLNEYGLSKIDVFKYCAYLTHAYRKVKQKVDKHYIKFAELDPDNTALYSQDKNGFQYNDCFPLAGEMVLISLELKKLNIILDGVDTTNKVQINELKLAGKAVATSVREALQDTSHPQTIESLKQMTQLVRGTTAVIQSPQNQDALDKHLKNTKAVYQQKWPKAHIIGGALLMVAGAALMALAVTAAVTTFGVSTPLSAVAIAIGAKAMVVGAVLTGVLAGSVLGASAALVDEGVKTKKSSRFKMFGAGQQVTKAAKQQVKESQNNDVDVNDSIVPLNKQK